MTGFFPDNPCMCNMIFPSVSGEITGRNNFVQQAVVYLCRYLFEDSVQKRRGHCGNLQLSSAYVRKAVPL